VVCWTNLKWKANTLLSFFGIFIFILFFSFTYLNRSSGLFTVKEKKKHCQFGVGKWFSGTFDDRQCGRPFWMKHIALGHFQRKQGVACILPLEAWMDSPVAREYPPKILPFHTENLSLSFHWLSWVEKKNRNWQTNWPSDQSFPVK
jgi:hypothetical protein